MLSCLSSREITDWRVYERFYGPVGPMYEQDALRLIAQALGVEGFPAPGEWLREREPINGEDWMR